MPCRRWTDEEDARLVELARQGFCVAAIAEHLGRTRAAISARLGSSLPRQGAQRRKFTKQEKKLVKELRARGETFEEIAEQLDRSIGSVKACAAYMGISKRRGTNGPKPPARRCLMHRGLFQPAHRHEFVCRSCKDSEAWQTGTLQ